MDKLSLEARIEAELISYAGKMCVYVNDFKGNTIEIGADEKFETASCIKTFILADLFSQVENGTKDLYEKLKYTKKNYINGSGVIQSLDEGVEMTAINFAKLMIIVSDNVATNILIDYLGIDHINKTIQELGFKDTILHNKIDFEKYDKLGTTTPRDYGRLFELIAKKELISEEASNKMLDIFKMQHYNSMIVRDFPQYYLDSEDTGEEELIYVASKSGSMDACRNDGGLVFTPYGPYVIVMFNKEFHDSLYYANHDATVYGGKVSRMIFDEFIALKGKIK